MYASDGADRQPVVLCIEGTDPDRGKQDEGSQPQTEGISQVSSQGGISLAGMPAEAHEREVHGKEWKGIGLCEIGQGSQQPAEQAASGVFRIIPRDDNPDIYEQKNSNQKIRIGVDEGEGMKYGDQGKQHDGLMPLRDAEFLEDPSAGDQSGNARRQSQQMQGGNRVHADAEKRSQKPGDQGGPDPVDRIVKLAFCIVPRNGNVGGRIRR